MGPSPDNSTETEPKTTTTKMRWLTVLLVKAVSRGKRNNFVNRLGKPIVSHRLCYNGQQQLGIRIVGREYFYFWGIANRPSEHDIHMEEVWCFDG